MTRPVAIVSHPGCAAHDTGAGHPEAARRLDAIEAALGDDAELRPLLLQRAAANASEEDVGRVHTPAHVARLRAACAEARRRGGRAALDEDTPVSAASWEAALASAGCAIAAAEAVVAGELAAAFALSRPPGHHASADRASGFCLLNNVAITIRRLQARGAARRVLVVDLDAHHGDGTQEIFYDDPSVYVLSLHQSPHYPWTGAPDERGRALGAGTTRNVPLPAGTTGAEYRAHVGEALDTALAGFDPDVTLVSAGFDALAGDPEGGLLLAPADYHAIATTLVERLAARRRGGVAAVLEGGYRLDLLGRGVVNFVRALALLPAAT